MTIAAPSQAAPDFDAALRQSHIGPLRAAGLSVLQVNVGKQCNQACKHCHVDAGPARTEIMSAKTVDAVLAAVERFRIPTVDITGGAPELNPDFRRLASGARALGAHVIARHNLTIQFEPGMEGLVEFYRDEAIELIASLPYFLAAQTDAQRGRGVFDRSIEAMRRLNAAGYAAPDSGLELNLVYNPVGAFLPPDQAAAERDFRRELRARHGLEFNRLFTVTNMPIRRFLDFLHRSGNYEPYMSRLVQSFNPATVEGLMCRTMVSVSWDGLLYDCDFNQMLDMQADAGGRTITDLDWAALAERTIRTGSHCFGCTAGAGSSCGGALAAN